MPQGPRQDFVLCHLFLVLVSLSVVKMATALWGIESRYQTGRKERPIKTKCKEQKVKRQENVLIARLCVNIRKLILFPEISIHISQPQLHDVAALRVGDQVLSIYSRGRDRHGKGGWELQLGQPTDNIYQIPSPLLSADELTLSFAVST